MFRSQQESWLPSLCTVQITKRPPAAGTGTKMTKRTSNVAKKNHSVWSTSWRLAKCYAKQEQQPRRNTNNLHRKSRRTEHCENTQKEWVLGITDRYNTGWKATTETPVGIDEKISLKKTLKELPEPMNFGWSDKEETEQDLRDLVDLDSPVPPAREPTPMSPTITFMKTSRRFGRDRKLCHKSGSNSQDTNRTDRLELPLSTVKVYSYYRHENPKTIAAELSRFGSISKVIMTSQHTAYVVFVHLIDSCQAVNELSNERLSKDNRLYCHWLHRVLKNKEVVSDGKSLCTVWKSAA